MKITFLYYCDGSTLKLMDKFSDKDEPSFSTSLKAKRSDSYDVEVFGSGLFGHKKVRYFSDGRKKKI